jgi:NAD-dependent deacetylase
MGWERNPQLVWDFYQARRNQLFEVEPNPGHLALTTLEEYLDEMLLVTQNVDNLHERAGSKNLIHIHGELEKLRCEECDYVGIMMEGPDLTSSFVSCQECSNAVMRPHIVWFHEMPMQMGEIEKALNQCDVFIAIGTSGHVYPAAGFLASAKQQGSHCIGINLDPPLNFELFDEFHQGKAGEVLPELVHQWINTEQT